ncbi:MAG: hypothetical protein H6832_11005 [Planctomycetes bacterium]|nr:hypothetical protein [Planctomycetota bacterium]MCB9891151.1 hypothetical protein [Planctomycetota bacterium]MCB9918918.1 hypothetical protein [Planctomycetota bacterium]
MQAHNHKRDRVVLRHLFFVLVAALGACSGGGSSSSVSAGPRSIQVLIDTSTGSQDLVEARVDIATLESASGAFTENLLDAPQTLAWSHPLASPSGLDLKNVPPGGYVALHLVVGQASVRVRHGNGQSESVLVPSFAFRIPFEEALVAPGFWLHVRHRVPLALTRDSAGQAMWQPDLVARRGELQPVTEVSATARGSGSGTMLASLDNAGGMLVMLGFDDSSKLSSDTQSGSLTRDRFLELHGRSGELEVSGDMRRDGSILVHSAHGRDSASSGTESKVYGKITSVDATTKSFRVQVQWIERGAAGLQRDPLPELNVLTGSARIHRSSDKLTNLDFAALGTGQIVEVEWKGSQNGPDIMAHEIEIEDSSSGGSIGPEIEGKIGRVNVTKSEFVVVPRNNDPLWVGGKQVASAEVVVSSATRLVRKTDSGLVSIGLNDITTTDRVWILGRVVSDTRVEASLVRVRDDSR